MPLKEEEFFAGFYASRTCFGHVLGTDRLAEKVS